MDVQCDGSDHGNCKPVYTIPDLSLVTAPISDEMDTPLMNVIVSAKQDPAWMSELRNLSIELLSDLIYCQAPQNAEHCKQFVAKLSLQTLNGIRKAEYFYFTSDQHLCNRLSASSCSSAR